MSAPVVTFRVWLEMVLCCLAVDVCVSYSKMRTWPESSRAQPPGELQQGFAFIPGLTGEGAGSPAESRVPRVASAARSQTSGKPHVLSGCLSSGTGDGEDTHHTGAFWVT